MKKIEDEIKQPDFRNPQQKAVINLIYTSNWLQKKLQEIFKSFGITSQQFNILRILNGQEKQSISAKEIKDRMLDQHSDVSRLLNRLIAKELVSKTTCPSDKRASDVMITSRGRALLKTINKKQDELDALLALTCEESTVLSDLLDKSRNSKDSFSFSDQVPI